MPCYDDRTDWSAVKHQEWERKMSDKRKNEANTDYSMFYESWLCALCSSILKLSESEQNKFWILFEELSDDGIKTKHKLCNWYSQHQQDDLARIRKKLEDVLSGKVGVVPQTLLEIEKLLDVDGKS